MNGVSPPPITLMLETRYQTTASERYWKLSFVERFLIEKKLVLEALNTWNKTMKYVVTIERSAKL